MAWAKVERLATRCGLLGALGEAVADGWVGEAPPVGGAELVAALRDGSRRRARETLDLDRVGTSLEWFVDFLVATGRVPFYPLRHAGDIETSIYNSETLEMFAEYIRRRGSRQAGRVGAALASDTVDTYVSTVRVLRNLEAHYRVTLDTTNVVMPAASKRTRQLQGPKGERQLKRGIRAAMLRQLAAEGYDRHSASGKMGWCAALVAHNLLLRGIELGHGPGKPFDTAKHATFGAIEFRAPCADSAWLPWLIWYVVPAKDAGARRRVCPMPLRRRGTGALGSDPLCAYDAVVILWMARTSTPPPTEGRVQGALALQPFFVGRNGETWDTHDTRTLAQHMARALGLPAAEFGGKSFRIGGATDWRDVFGADAERIIRQRGRWHSDIATLYQRALAEVHLRGSATVGSADSADLESLCRGWAQPATFR